MQQVLKKAELLRDASGEKLRRVKGGKAVGSLNEGVRSGVFGVRCLGRIGTRRCLGGYGLAGGRRCWTEMRVYGVEGLVELRGHSVSVVFVCMPGIGTNSHSGRKSVM